MLLRNDMVWSQLYYLPLWANHLTSMAFIFLVNKMGIIKIRPSLTNPLNPQMRQQMWKYF